VGTLVASIFQGILLGLGAAVPIGPVNVEIARRTLRSGFASGCALGCGAVSVDVAYALLTSTTLAQLPSQPLLYHPLRFAASAMLVFFAINCLDSAARGLNRPVNLLAARSPLSWRKGYLTGVLMTLFNPMTLLFWFVVVPGASGATAPNDLPMICAGVFVGTLAWVVSFTSLLSLLGRFRKTWWLVLADAIGAILLFAFAAATLLRSNSPHL